LPDPLFNSPGFAMSADRNLLFGILAVQLDFISKDALIAAMNAWLLDKGKPIGEILRDQGHLSLERLQLLTALVAEHLRQHGDDPQKSLAALSSVPNPLRQQLAAIPDEAVQRSIAEVGRAKAVRPVASADGSGRRHRTGPPVARLITGVRGRLTIRHPRTPCKP
jgi:hypothetical protein